MLFRSCAETARILLPVKFLTPNLKSPWAISYLSTNFGCTSVKIYTCFKRKTAVVMQNFQNFGAGGGGGDHFLTKPPKGTSLADFKRFEPLCVRIRSRVLSLGDWTKKGTLQKVTERLYFNYLRGLPNSIKCNQNRHLVGVAHLINHTKLGDDRSREYKVTEGRILACSIGMACR